MCNKQHKSFYMEGSKVIRHRNRDKLRVGMPATLPLSHPAAFLLLNNVANELAEAKTAFYIVCEVTLH